MSLKSTSEKVSFNVSPADIGYVDLLVSHGIYTSRTDFFRSAVRNELTQNQLQIKHLLNHVNASATKKHNYNLESNIGICSYNDHAIDKWIKDGTNTHIFTIGVLDLTKIKHPQRLFQAVSKITVFGKFRADKQIIDHYLK